VLCVLRDSHPLKRHHRVLQFALGPPIALPRSTIPFRDAPSAPSVGTATAFTDIAQLEIVTAKSRKDIVGCDLRIDERGVGLVRL
jgi:hypothetical protein